MQRPGVVPTKRSWLAIVVAAGATVALAGCGTQGGADASTAASDQGLRERLLTLAPGVVSARPGAAALMVRAASELERGPDATIAMLDTALEHRGVARVIAAHDGPVLDVARTRRAVASSGSDGFLRIWEPDTGAQLAERRLEHPAERLAAAAAGEQVATADADGRVAVWSADAPPALDAVELEGRGPRRPLELGFVAHDTTLVAVGRDGAVARWEVATGTRLPSLHLRDAQIDGSWSEQPSERLRLVAAELGEPDYFGKAAVLIASAAGYVARVDLETLRGETLLGPDDVSGSVTSLAVQEFGDPQLVAGTTSGLVLRDDDGAVEQDRGPAVAGVAFDDGQVVSATSDGLVRRLVDADGDAIGSTPAAGRDATRVVGGHWGAAAAHADGSVSVLDAQQRGSSLAPGETSPVATFGPHGELLVAEGYDANHVDRLLAVRPGEPGRDEYGSAVAHRVVRSYRPDPDWWDAEESDAWYVNAATMSDRYVVAGGQDPSGTAVVLVWDAASGDPLARLPLTSGGATGDGPSIASQVAVLPEKGLIAAYSILQESIVLWSAHDWRQVATVDVGPAGGFSVSPDEETIAVATLADDTSGVEAGIPHSRVQMVDVDAGRVVSGFRASARGGSGLLPEIHRVELAPDGDRLATLDETSLLVRTLGGRQMRRVPLDGRPADLAWRPDGRLIAVALFDRGTVLVDPADGRVSAALPPPPGAQAISPDWSRDGASLATTHLDYDSEGDPTAPPVTVWRVGEEALEERMCDLAGRRPDAAAWRRLTGAAELPACPVPPAPSAGAPADALEQAEVAYLREDRLYAADREGRSVAIGAADPQHWPPVAFVWSRDGALAWAAEGRAYRLGPGAARPRSWPCPCTAAGFAGETLVAIDAAGQALLRFAPSADGPVRLPLRGMAGYEPKLLAGLPDGDVIATGYRSPPSRATPTELFRVPADGGEVRSLGDAGATIYGGGTLDPSGRLLAFLAGWSSGVCYSPTDFGVFDVAHDRFSRPPGPADFEDPHQARSLTWSRAGELSIAIAPNGCDDDGTVRDEQPEAELYELQDDELVSTGRRAYDLQRGVAATAVVTDVADLAASAATLWLEAGDRERVRVTSGASRVAVRP